jgi:hypothetical protein
MSFQIAPALDGFRSHFSAACVDEILGWPADLSWLSKEMRLRYRLKRLLYVLSDASLNRLARKLDLTLRTPGPLNPIQSRSASRGASCSR